MYDNPNADFNNNFDGVLDADNCSYDSFSHDESSDMDTFSDVDLTDNSDDEIITTQGVEGQGCAYNNCVSNDNTTTLLQTDTTMATSKLSEQLQIRDNININIINNGARREGERGRVEEEQQYFFNFSQSLKAKPKLPEVKLALQDLASAAAVSASHSWEHVVDHKCEKDCGCMSDPSYMYCMNGMQAQNSF